MSINRDLLQQKGSRYTVKIMQNHLYGWLRASV